MSKHREGANKIISVFKADEQVEYERFRNNSRMLLGRHFFLKRVFAGKAYLESEHDYALFRGDADTGRRRRMLGREAKDLNTEYERKYMDDKTARMYKWKWLKGSEPDEG